MRRLAKELYVESDYPGVTVGALVTPHGVVCIDAPTRPVDARAWRAALGQISPAPLRYVVLLDGHRDRLPGSPALQATSVAHDAVAERVLAQPDAPVEAGSEAELMPELAGTRLIVPAVTFSQQLTLYVGPRAVQVDHRGGCSSGASWIHFPEAKTLFVGDLLTVGMPPFLADADLDAWMGVLDELRRARYRGYTFVPGRGKPASQEALKRFASYLGNVRRRLERFHAAGRPRAELTSLVPVLLTDFKARRDDGAADLYARRLRYGLERLLDRMED